MLLVRNIAENMKIFMQKCAWLNAHTGHESLPKRRICGV